MKPAFTLKPRPLRDDMASPTTLRTGHRQPLGFAFARELQRSWMRTTALALAAIMLGSSVSGCAVGPDYDSPAISLALLHDVGGVTARKANRPPPPLDTWWIGFNDPTLTRIIRRALDQNLDLAAAIAHVKSGGPDNAASPVARKSDWRARKELARV